MISMDIRIEDMQKEIDTLIESNQDLEMHLQDSDFLVNEHKQRAYDLEMEFGQEQKNSADKITLLERVIGQQKRQTEKNDSKIKEM